MKKSWVYLGDVNIEHGGVYFNLLPSDWADYATIDFVAVEPASDWGGKENHFLVRAGQVTKPCPADDLPTVLRTCGYELQDGGIRDCTGEVHAPESPEYLQLLAEACYHYGRYDEEDSVLLKIGEACPLDSGADIPYAGRAVNLRKNTNLRKWLERNWVR